MKMLYRYEPVGGNHGQVACHNLSQHSGDGWPVAVRASEGQSQTVKLYPVHPLHGEVNCEVRLTNERHIGIHDVDGRRSSHGSAHYA